MQVWPNYLWVPLETRYITTLIHKLVIPFSTSQTENSSHAPRRIGQASKVPPECVRMNHDLVREGVFNLKDLDQLTKRAVCNTSTGPRFLKHL